MKQYSGDHFIYDISVKIWFKIKLNFAGIQYLFFKLQQMNQYFVDNFNYYFQVLIQIQLEIHDVGIHFL